MKRVKGFGVKIVVVVGLSQIHESSRPVVQSSVCCKLCFASEPFTAPLNYIKFSVQSSPVVKSSVCAVLCFASEPFTGPLKLHQIFSPVQSSSHRCLLCFASEPFTGPLNYIKFSVQTSRPVSVLYCLRAVHRSLKLHQIFSPD